MYLAHLTDYSHLEKSGDFSIENIGILSKDGGVASCNSLPRDMSGLGRFVIYPDNISVFPTGATLL